MVGAAKSPVLLPSFPRLPYLPSDVRPQLQLLPALHLYYQVPVSTSVIHFGSQAHGSQPSTRAIGRVHCGNTTLALHHRFERSTRTRPLQRVHPAQPEFAFHHTTIGHSTHTTSAEGHVSQVLPGPRLSKKMPPFRSDPGPLKMLQATLGPSEPFDRIRSSEVDGHRNHKSST